MNTPARTPAAILALALLVACAEHAPEEPAPPPPPEPEPVVMCDCVLSSWRVAARGRHLHLDIDCPEPYDHLDGRVEFTSAALRTDFDATRLADDDFPALVRMTPGTRLGSFLDDPEPRVEAVYEVPAPVAAWFQRDVAFDTDYQLIGANSNAAMRAMLETVGLELPEHVVTSFGIFGDFPGVNIHPGAELPIEAWPDIGLTGGPIAPDGALPEGWEDAGAIRGSLAPEM